jgi:hypothetical protein
VSPVPHVRIADRFSDSEFDGELLGGRYITTRNGDTPRWVEMGIYRLDSGTGWVLHRIGQSLVYHTAGTACSTASGGLSGEPAPASRLPDSAHSCDRCKPPWPEDLEPSDQVRIEFPRHTIDRCETREQVTQRLTGMRARASGTRTSTVSEPVRELLAMAAAVDPEFASGPKPTEKIT